MKKYTVTQGFHLGEICQDITKGTEISFDAAKGKLKMGGAEFDIRSSPIVGAIKAGWLTEKPVKSVFEHPTKYGGVEESRPISPGKEVEPKKKKELERIQYEEDVQPIAGVEKKEVTKKAAPKIGFEDREDEQSSVSFERLKTLTGEQEQDLAKNWDLKKHWATRKKEMLKIDNINALMRIAALDKTLKPHIESRIKELSPLGQEVDANLKPIEEKKSAKKKAEKKTTKKKEEKKPKKATKKKSKKAEKPAPQILGKDFDQDIHEKIQSGEIEVQKINTQK